MNDVYVLTHHGVKGQKWYVRRTPAQLGHKVKTKVKERRAEKQEIKKRLKEYSKDTSGISAAKTYYKLDTSNHPVERRALQRSLDLKTASLKPEQIKNGRYKVAKARTFRALALSTTAGAATITALASTGIGAFAAGAVGGAVQGAVYSSSRGGYYREQARAYGKDRAKNEIRIDKKKRKEING